ncbi:MAG TPA: carboxypeptidase regulatory-like domain-containing protein [Terriglobales bacterium]|nr:carboxypeptidase regulatory-like domain-containing protein [Terriglobales bacterium]
MIRRFHTFRDVAVLLLLFAFAASAAFAQTAGSLHGKVADPSGAVIPGATITVKSSTGQTATATSSGDGSYDVKNLAPGQYSVSVSAQGFAPYSKGLVEISAGRAQLLDIPLQIEVVQEKVNVESEGNTLDTAPSNNANTVVLKGKDLDALSDDPDELQNELQALAGPSAGPNGGQMYIDGFTAGQLPPKSAIREIRINQNPFSAQYDKLGYGRIEIFTKPGSDKFHGQLEFNENNSIFNSRNPFSLEKPDYHSEQYEGNFGGPLGKKASFFIDGQRRNINDVAIVNPQCGGFVLAECADVNVPNPHTRTNFSPRFDYQLSNTNTFTGRYQFWNNHEDNNGVGQSGSTPALPSLAYTSDETEHTVQVSDTQVFGSKIVNETRFQYNRDSSDQNPLSTAPQLSVPGFFTTGGNSAGHVVNQENHYEIQNYTSYVSGNHSMRFGGRLRISQASDLLASNFNGTFTYPSVDAFVNNQPNQFSITTGQPLISDTFLDLGVYAEDDWKARPNLTFSYGLRYETQSDIDDYTDFAPRIGVAWGLGRKGSTPKTVLRAGYGIFYDRFPQSLVLQAERLNGTAQQSYTVRFPTFDPNDIPTSFSGLAGVPSNVYRIDPNLRAPYVLQAAVGIEHQLTKTTKLSLTYLNARGLHQLFTNNINAPLPGTFPANPVYPLGFAAGNIYDYQSEGIFKQNQLMTNINMRVGPSLSIFGFYSLSFANSDTSGAGSFPSDPYDPTTDYGRAAFDVRNRIFIGGTFVAPFGLRLSPFVFANSGQPYNITIPEDILGTSIFNARPGLAVGSAGCPVLSTTLPSCFFIPNPGQAYSPIPINFGQGPANVSVNLRVSKTVGLGPVMEGTTGRRGGGGGGDRAHDHGGFGGFGGGGRGGFFGGGGGTDHRYNLTFSVGARNLFNRQNLAAPVGVLSQPCIAGQDCSFGHSISITGGPFGSQASNRRVDMQVQFSF